MRAWLTAICLLAAAALAFSCSDDGNGGNGIAPGATRTVSAPTAPVGPCLPVSPAPAADGNLFGNPSFEDGKAPWCSLETEAWGPPFEVSRDLALDGTSSAHLRLRSEDGGAARIYGAVQEITPEEFPEVLSGNYYVERWEKGTPKQYLQFVVIVFGADNIPAEVSGQANNHQMRYILAGADSQPTFVSNARYVFVTREEPKSGEWVHFERNISEDFEQLWGEVPRGFDSMRVLFEVRWDERQPSDPPSAADVYYDGLYLGPAR